MDNKIEELEEQLEELRAKVNELEQALSLAKLAEWPQEGDCYWFVTADGLAASGPWDNDLTDAGRAEIGNVFRTEEEADFEIERLRVIAELKKFAMSREEVKAARSCKYIYYFYSDGDGELDTSTCCGIRTPGVLYFESSDAALKAVEAVGEDRVKKYYLGVED